MVTGLLTIDCLVVARTSEETNTMYMFLLLMSLPIYQCSLSVMVHDQDNIGRF
jgi:hypothetical protein